MSKSTTLNHIAICPDGNRRWARQNNKSLEDSYGVATHNLWVAIEKCCKSEVAYLSIQVFNRSNWSRDKVEVKAALDACFKLCDRIEKSPMGIGVNWVGRRNGIPLRLRNKVTALEKARPDHLELVVTLYLDYDPNEHIREAAISGPVLLDELAPVGVPSVDLFIRTSLDYRTSQFDPVRIMNAELYFIDGGTAEMNEQKVTEALKSYASRSRRFGA